MRYRDKSCAAIFDDVYLNNVWGSGHNHPDDLDSGDGSHEDTIVEPYVAALRGWLGNFSDRPVIVDVGCGDFAVSSRVHDLAARYIGCDVSHLVIQHNRKYVTAKNVEFRQVDATSEPLPDGDVAIVREVLQHLSNGAISSILENLQSFPHVIVTEKLPLDRAFEANKDTPTGPDIRLGIKSGVVLTERPFSVRCDREHVLCEIVDPHGSGRLVTTLYEGLTIQGQRRAVRKSQHR